MTKHTCNVHGLKTVNDVSESGDSSASLLPSGLAVCTRSGPARLPLSPAAACPERGGEGRGKEEEALKRSITVLLCLHFQAAHGGQQLVDKRPTTGNLLHRHR